jgi:nucleoid DNA-binding protein
VLVQASKANAALKLKGLIDRVTEASGAKRKDVKTVVEATLIQLGQALARGEAMNLPGLGHLRVARKATADTPSMTLKLRQGEPGKAKPKAAGTSAEDEDKEPLAEDSDQG